MNNAFFGTAALKVSSLEKDKKPGMMRIVFRKQTGGEVIFTEVASSVAKELKVGDVVRLWVKDN